MAAHTDRRTVLIFARQHTEQDAGWTGTLAHDGAMAIITLAPSHAVEPVLTNRKPLLLFRLDGVLLLRLAERALIALLFHDPPRITRFDGWPAPYPAYCYVTGGERSCNQASDCARDTAQATDARTAFIARVA